MWRLPGGLLLTQLIGQAFTLNKLFSCIQTFFHNCFLTFKLVLLKLLILIFPRYLFSFKFGIVYLTANLLNKFVKLIRHPIEDCSANHLILLHLIYLYLLNHLNFLFDFFKLLFHLLDNFVKALITRFVLPANSFHLLFQLHRH